MKKVYITFAGRCYDERVAKTVEMAPQYGCDEVRVYDDRWLLDMSAGRHGFYSLNKWLWNTKMKFGFGWCAWKPYIIRHALDQLSTGDIVLYVDADTVPVADLSVLFCEAEKEGVIVFHTMGFRNTNVVRRDCFIAMGCDEERYHNAPHACGRFQLFQKGNYLADQILAEWLAYSVNPLCQQWGDYQSRYGPDLADFTKPLSEPGGGVHRTEQAVLSLLAAKYELPLYREACQNGWPIHEAYMKELNLRGDYPQLFEQLFCAGDRRDCRGSRFRNVPLI
jgi:hypothetical protein